MDIGYTRAKFGFDGETCAVLTSIEEQSPDIALGVNKSVEARQSYENNYNVIGAGDQGMMFGYATTETQELMPLPIILAHQLSKRLADVRKKKIAKGIRPDGKTQVTVLYEDGKPAAVTTIVVSTQHDPDIELSEIRNMVEELVINPVIPGEFLPKKPTIHVNPTGRFVKGGPAADTGLTGRKIIVDTYGGWVPHGGGALSGKDATKVDRSANYMARYAAKNVVAAGLAEKLMIQVAYAIGVASPVSFMLNAYGTQKVDLSKLKKVVAELFDFRPAAIIDKLELRTPFYRKTAAYGHFGRNDVVFPWEKLDMVDELKRAFNL
jgi:S-adenosylmethionine synthetase